MRKRITKELPKVEENLRKTLEKWEDEYGRPFLVHGEQYLETLEAASAKAPPPRSKTPNALIPARDPASTKSLSSTQRGGTVRGPPPRSHTPTASQTIRGNPLASSTIKKSSPSKIPSRAPLSSLQHGGNSPERKDTLPRLKENFGSSVMSSSSSRIMGPPPSRGPPPKMKDLFVPPTPTPTGADDRLALSTEIVRYHEPEDVYDDRPTSRFQGSFSHSSANYSSNHHNTAQHPRMNLYSRPESQLSQLSASHSQYRYNPDHDRYQPQPNRPSHQQHHQQRYNNNNNNHPAERTPHYAPSSPSSRHISSTSSYSQTSSTAAPHSETTSIPSISENWETYSSTSSPSADAADDDDGGASATYYAKVRLQQSRMKRVTPEGG
ncbi:hypothetical protein LTS18_000742, partial [Coniosporium uncinatum]